VSIGPKIINKDPFTQTLRGTFGRFKTASSHDVRYLLTSIPINELSELSTASALFTKDAIKFDELIQRDIDQNRVVRIANDYLVGSANKVVFFPPLLACIVLMDASGSMQRRYEDYEETIDTATGSRVLKAVWDKDGFELQLALGTKLDADRKITLEGGKEEWFHDAGQIRLNPKRAKLVVLDGQHRLEALRLVKNGPHQAILQGIEVPVCLIFTPKATAGSAEDMIEDFRELFVRVNEEAKRVSGHFLILLQDDSYTAAAIRALAEAWRLNTTQGYSLLHLLEWNQRVEEQTRKRTRPFSITTIGIIHDTLSDHLFKEQLASTVLRLDDVSPDFEAADANFNYADLGDQTNGHAIDSIVSKQISAHVVPALSILLLTPAPYRRLQDDVRMAFERLKKEIAGHNASFASLEEYFLKHKYSEEEVAENPVKTVLKEFLSWVQVSEKDQIYFLHAFQQGLIRTWIRLCGVLSAFGITPTEAATATVAGLEVLALAPAKEYLAPSRKYGQRVLWKNERVNFGAVWTRDAWFNILLASFLKKSVAAAALKSITTIQPGNLEKIATEISKQAAKAVSDYCERLRRELLRDTKANLSELVAHEKYLSLQALQGGDADAKKKYDKEIEGIVEERFGQATEELSNALEVDAGALILPSP
jgi:DNA-sulfur modification-associated